MESIVSITLTSLMIFIIISFIIAVVLAIITGIIKPIINLWYELIRHSKHCIEEAKHKINSKKKSKENKLNNKIGTKKIYEVIKYFLDAEIFSDYKLTEELSKEWDYGSGYLKSYTVELREKLEKNGILIWVFSNPDDDRRNPFNGSLRIGKDEVVALYIIAFLVFKDYDIMSLYNAHKSRDNISDFNKLVESGEKIVNKLHNIVSSNEYLLIDDIDKRKKDAEEKDDAIVNNIDDIINGVHTFKNIKTNEQRSLNSINQIYSKLDKERKEKYKEHIKRAEKISQDSLDKDDEFSVEIHEEILKLKLKEMGIEDE